jgi:hypothetical protein
MTALAALRIFGPMHLEELAGQLHSTLYHAQAEARRLRRDGLAEGPDAGLWDVTEAGRDEFVRWAKAPAVPAWATPDDGRRVIRRHPWLWGGFDGRES